MESNRQLRSRPLVVKLALAILVLHVGLLDLLDAIHGDWNSLLFFIKMGTMALIAFVPLWFAYCGKNWARWLLVTFVVAELCLIFGVILPRLSNHHAVTTSWILWTCFHNAIDILAVAALFLPSSNRWFRKYERISA